MGWRSSLTWTIVGYSVLAVPALYLSYYLREATPFAVTLVYGLAPLAPVLIAWLHRRARTREHEPAARGVGRHEQRARGHRVAQAVRGGGPDQYLH